jgi:hypothetical protein
VSVSSAGALPCFTLAPDELKRTSQGGVSRIYNVEIWDRVEQKARKVWELYADPYDKPIMLRDGACISYGMRLPGTQMEGAPELAPGVLYTVNIGAANVDRTDPTRFYSARFCIAVSPQGERRAVPLASRQRKCE